MLWTTKMESEILRRSAVIFVMLMMVQATLPMAANAQTNPPQGPGDWTIPQGDVTYYNNSQALVQGNIEIYGTLIVENSNRYALLALVE